jgi:mannosyl-3-phosphoglycerate phosphatase
MWVDIMKIILTDLDGTLLDSKTYEFEPAWPVLEQLRERGIPVIFCSSKTRAELEYWRGRLDNHHPFVVENGGAVYVPREYFQFLASTPQQRNGYDVFELGIPYPELIACLKDVSEECECPVRGFSDMTVEEVMESCQLPRVQAILSLQREYDEPFLIEEPQKADALLKGIEQRGKGWTQGGRFYHVTGKQDKAKAAALLKILYQFALGPIHVVALGDHLNDVPLLQMADTPIIVNSDSAQLVKMAVPTARVTESAGPLGWKEAVLAILQE